ncbi:hemerythrin domain-containing protein [Sphingomonas crocodyli]|uniref:Hemerythrin domain-containing protein n=1 Tax=Sphingomonas crocodyli TaxID=1979270 RepID=A0A437LYE8_9SPHN|nr:hemerythrin domain-containing protein [Sphingomonas crocodyli]RVT90344.1 hemerythrin domain-containing protein [Sphingomonas crocodyli]
MSLFDKIVAAITPPESDETRFEARRRARGLCAPGDWLDQVIDHHEQIEAAFEEVRSASQPQTQRSAQRKLATLLTGHANAEEAVLYPALADDGHEAHAGLGYEEQAATKVQLALLEKLEPLSQDFLDKLEHIRGAVTHHMYHEESSWFPDLKTEVANAEQARIGARYTEEYQRYVDMATA